MSELKCVLDSTRFTIQFCDYQDRLSAVAARAHITYFLHFGNKLAGSMLKRMTMSYMGSPYSHSNPYLHDDYDFEDDRYDDEDDRDHDDPPDESDEGKQTVFTPSTITTSNDVLLSY